MPGYQIKDLGDRRVLVFDNHSYETIYSKKVIELIIERKGLERAPQYFSHKEKRSYLLKPLFNYLSSCGYRGLKVLEVGCSAGQFTELLNEQDFISEIYTFDIDRIFVEVTKIKVVELGLNKVKKVDCFTTAETTRLSYQDGFFDLVILSGVLEHLPFENRFIYVDEYYKKLKAGGLICFFDTPNSNYPFETHSVGLPFISRFSPQKAFIYAKLFGKLRGAEFTEFVRAGTAWRNATYYDCLPHSLTIIAKDISEEVGYGYAFLRNSSTGLIFKIFSKPVFSLLWVISKRIGFPISFYLPFLNVVIKKVQDLER